MTVTRPCGNTLCDDPTYTFTYYQRATALPTGTTLLGLSQRMFEDLERTRASILDSQKTVSGTIRLVGGMTVCLHVFPALLKEFRRRHPGVEVKLTTEPETVGAEVVQQKRVAFGHRVVAKAAVAERLRRIDVGVTVNSSRSISRCPPRLMAAFIATISTSGST